MPTKIAADDANLADVQRRATNMRAGHVYVTLHQVLEVLRKHRVEIVEFAEKPAADEYRTSFSELPRQAEGRR